MRPVTIHAVFVATVLALGIVIGMIFAPGPWYAGLTKPPFNPPNWVFGPAWSILYVLIGIAGARTWIHARQSVAMRLWFLQMALNFLWSPAFFGARSPILGLMVILPLLVVILIFIAERWGSDTLAALLFVPYGAWVAFASLLNGAIYVLN
jgi:translocator protein